MANYKLSFTGKEVDEKLKTMVTSWNDLEDKPFYSSYVTGEDIILNETQMDGFSVMQDTIYAVQDPFSINLTEGTSYKVLWDNVEYTCAFTNDSQTGMSYLGNYNYVNMQSGGDIPFCIVFSNGHIFVATESTESSHTIQILSLETVTKEVIVKIDEKYIPNISWNKLEDKPFYEDVKYGKVLFDGVINEEDYEDYVLNENNAYVFSPERKFNGGFHNVNFIEVIIDGVAYISETYNIYTSVTGIGDQNLETFDFYMIDNTYGGGLSSSMYFKTSATRSVKVTQVLSRDLKQLDTKYIPFVTKTTTKTLSWDGNTNGLAAHYYDDRYYKVSDQVLTEQDVANGGRIVDSYGDIFDFTADDIRIINEGSESSFMKLNNKVYLTRDGIYFYKDNRYNYTVSLEINEFDGFVVETIRSPYINAYTKEESDAKYQPKTTVDWEQNDESNVTYIQNRTHYKEISELKTVFEEAEISFNGGYFTHGDGWYYRVNTNDFSNKLTLDMNKVYILTMENTEYVLTPKRRYGNAGDIYIGNPRYWSGKIDAETAHIPICIEANSSTGLVKRAMAQLGTYKIKIEEGKYLYHQLDEKYIPDTIARAKPTFVECVEYTVKDSNYTWCGINELSGDISFPKLFLYDGELYKTVSITATAFQNKPEITSIKLPNSLITIGNSVFANCTGIKNVVLPNSVTRIENFAFNQGGLETITWSENLEYIGQKAFASTPLTFAKIPGKNLTIDQEAFAGCTSLTDITLPENVYCDIYAFEACSNLAKVTFEGKPKYLHYTLFKDCNNLSEINVPWAEGEVLDAPWGATNATINYNYVG